MYFPTVVICGFLAIVLLTAIGLLSSRNLSEYMVRRGMLPRAFLQLTPVFVTGARWLAVLLIAIGLLRAAAVAGLLSAPWIGRYALPALLVITGLVLLWMTFRSRNPS